MDLTMRIIGMILNMRCCSVIGVATKDCVKSPTATPKTR